MEIFMRNINPSLSASTIKVEVARVLHSDDYIQVAGDNTPINFDVRIAPRQQGIGWLTVPKESIGSYFLQEYGGSTPRKTISDFRIRFERGKKTPNARLLDNIRRLPYMDPRAQQDEMEKEEQNLQEIQQHQVAIQAIQFGWECRDNVFSVEWEERLSDAVLALDMERGDFRITVRSLEETRIVAIHAAQIYWTSVGIDSHDNSFIYLSLNYAPSFESESLHNAMSTMFINGHKSKPTRQRQSSFHPNHDPIAPYTSLCIRLICRGRRDIKSYRFLCNMAHVSVDEFVHNVERRGLFSNTIRQKFHTWVSGLPWLIAFQVEALSRNHTVNLKEVMMLHDPILRSIQLHGIEEIAALLQEFNALVKDWWYTNAFEISNLSDIRTLYTKTEQDFFSHRIKISPDDSTDLFQCLHAIVTPTTVFFEGPYPERSNRVIRTYLANQDSFMRVAFVDENRLSFRFARDLDGRDFINRRVRAMLREGLRVGGRHFKFLAYSQSALKEHAVWFVKKFQHSEHGVTDASTIIARLGSFKDLAFDPTLIYCPARYGARVSQAFTATDSSLTAEAEEVIYIKDIKRGKYCFTDGVGTISPHLARAIWAELHVKKGRLDRRRDAYPRAFQVRFQGSKGMLSVDHRLSGNIIGIRPSMIKFDAPNSLDIEIARAFDRPGKFFLNRPLIMLLEGLGVPYETFEKLQNDAVRDVHTSMESMDRAARLLEAYGLGASFHMTSVMLNLHKLGFGPLEDVFWRQMMDFAVNPILRELKHRARIPVPGGWNLVGVVDIHGYLKEKEIFACIDTPNERHYLDGPVTISRSPTIHPGDVQVVRAIGCPPPGSPFAVEPLKNCVVFSTQGKRPLPSCLGGGDLDGDEYVVTERHDLRPTRTCDPANYEPAKRRLLDHESTMNDVADFVAEYISSDTLGIIATNWLVTVDQSDRGIFDKDCMLLAELHSDAVDYPKTGEPVPLDKLPRLKFKAKPDWNAPETVTPGSKQYYESQRAIGRLFRAITLPALAIAARASRTQRRHLNDSQLSFEEVMKRFLRGRFHSNSIVLDAIGEHLMHYIDVTSYDPHYIRNIWDLYEYYVPRLQGICTDHTLSNTRETMLTEEEAIIGTIVAKCSQQRKRKDLMSHLREQTKPLVDTIRKEITGDDTMSLENALERAWIAFRLAVMEDDKFGARSFQWLALGVIFDVTKEIDDLDRKSISSRR